MSDHTFLQHSGEQADYHGMPMNNDETGWNSDENIKKMEWDKWVKKYSKT